VIASSVRQLRPAARPPRRIDDVAVAAAALEAMPADATLEHPVDGQDERPFDLDG
jgi:hypothetical protein